MVQEIRSRQRRWLSAFWQSASLKRRKKHLLVLRLHRIKTDDRKRTTMFRIWIQIREGKIPQSMFIIISSTKRTPNVHVICKNCTLTAKNIFHFSHSSQPPLWWPLKNETAISRGIPSALFKALIQHIIISIYAEWRAERLMTFRPNFYALFSTCWTLVA